MNVAVVNGEETNHLVEGAHNDETLSGDFLMDTWLITFYSPLGMIRQCEHALTMIINLQPIAYLLWHVGNHVYGGDEPREIKTEYVVDEI